MKKLGIKLLLGIGVVIFACSDDFIDVAAEDANSDDFFNTEADYQSALIAAYDPLQSTYINVMCMNQ